MMIFVSTDHFSLVFTHGPMCEMCRGVEANGTEGAAVPVA